MAEHDDSDATPGDAEPAEDDSIDSFLRAAAQLPDDPAAAASSAKGIERGLHEGLLVAKRYRLDRLLGEGGMGIVWAATHTVTGRSSALKFLKGSTQIRDDLRRRFLREARVTSAIGHPNLVDVHDVFELEDGTPVMVMDLLSGETLGMRLERERRLSVEQAAALLLPVVSAVGAAHAVGIVHRDLKPENVFLVRDTVSGDRVKILDFGVAKLADSAAELHEVGTSTGTGAVLGTARYMAPEQALGDKDVDHRADIWALGVILYECLSGERPIKASSVGHAVLQMMGAGVEPLARRAPGLPVDVTTVVMRMLARDRSMRPESLHEVSEVLARYTSVRAPTFGPPLYAGKAVPEAFTATVADEFAAPRRPRAGHIALVWAGVLVVLGLSGLAISRGRALDGRQGKPALAPGALPVPSSDPEIRPPEWSEQAPVPNALPSAQVLAGPLPANDRGNGHGAKGAAASIAKVGVVPRTPTKSLPLPSANVLAAPEKIPVKAPGRRGLADQVPF